MKLVIAGLIADHLEDAKELQEVFASLMASIFGECDVRKEGWSTVCWLQSERVHRRARRGEFGRIDSAGIRLPEADVVLIDRLRRTIGAVRVV